MKQIIFSNIKAWASILFLSVTISVSSAQISHNSKWEIYNNTADAGFSESAIKLIEKQFDSTEAETMMIIYKGKVVMTKGDVTRRYMMHSLRKSFLNAVFGIYNKNGTIDIDKTLREIDLNDQGRLTDSEQNATIYDLLCARSGVYLPAAYSPKGMEERLPARHQFDAGQHWCYNNWDFNALSSIFNRLTNKDLFQVFSKEIAQAIGMEDFRVFDTYYQYETDLSEHPAYLFRMSARDLARFGSLFLNKGVWEKQQVVPKKWITKSTSIITKDLGEQFGNKGSYGMLWWIANRTSKPMYYGSGAGGQRVAVIPEADMVIVHLANTYEDKKVSEQEFITLVNMILDNQSEVNEAAASSRSFEPVKREVDAVKVSRTALEACEGSYHHPFLGAISITRNGSQLLMEMKVGKFRLHPLGDDRFFPEDIEKPIVFRNAENQEQSGKVKIEFEKNRNIASINFFRPS